MLAVAKIASRYLRILRAADKEEKGDNIQLTKEDEKLLAKIWSDLEGPASRTKKADAEEADTSSKGSVFGSEDFQEFWKSKYEGGKKKVPNTDAKTKQRYKEVSANTLLGKDKEFRKKVLEEFRKWKDQGSKEPKKDSRYKDKEWSFELSDEEDTKELLKAYDLALEDVADAAGLAGLPPTVKRIRILASTANDSIRVIAGDGKDPPKGWKMERTVDLAKKTIKNSTFFIPEDSPAGTGARVFGDQVQAAQKHGFKAIECEAFTDPPKWVGGIVWPKLGYDGPLPKTLHKKAAKFLEGSPKPWKISQLMMKGKEAQNFWTDNVPSELSLSFDLSKDSIGSRVLDGYLKAKGYR